MSWQEELRRVLAYLPWGPDAPWFLHQDPQAAWDACPNGRHLLWVIGKDPRLPPGDPRVRACAINLARVAQTSAALHYIPMHPATLEILRALEEGAEPRVEVADRYAEVKDVGEWGLRGDALDVWHFDRAVLYAAFAAFGVHWRLDFAAYHAGGLEYAVWKHDDGFVQRDLAQIVRRHFPEERFTRP